MSDLLIEDRGGVRILTMNRPDKRNALNHALTQALLAALHDTESNEDVRSIVLTGSGSAFCAGADLTEFKDLTPDKAHLVESRAELTMNLHGVFSRLSKPVVTAINGTVLDDTSQGLQVFQALRESTQANITVLPESTRASERLRRRTTASTRAMSSSG